MYLVISDHLGVEFVIVNKEKIVVYKICKTKKNKLAEHIFGDGDREAPSGRGNPPSPQVLNNLYIQVLFL